MSIFIPYHESVDPYEKGSSISVQGDGRLKRGTLQWMTHHYLLIVTNKS